MRLIVLFSCCLLLSVFSFAQETDSMGVFEYAQPKDYEIGGIKVLGANFSDDNAIIGVSGLKVGDKIRIPGPDIQKAIKVLWRLRLFTDVQLIMEKTIGDVVFLELKVQERPRLARPVAPWTPRSA